MNARATACILPALALLLAWSEAPAQSLNFGPPHIIQGDFLRPFGLAVNDATGELLVADTGHHSFKTAPVADLTGSYTFTQHGFVADRSDPAALTDPQAVAAHGATDVYVANTLKNTVFHYVLSGSSYVLDPLFASATPTTVAGLDIDLPRDLAIGSDGAVYLLDSGNNRILKADGPADTSWSVFYVGSDWANPYGMDIDAAGVIYVADTGNHRVVRIEGASATTIGGWGQGNGQFRFPRDVAVDQHGRLFVADTFNHRIQVLAPDGHHLRSIGHAPAVGTLAKVVVDSEDRVFVVDSDNNHVLAFLGASFPAPFDAYLRDFVGDDGAEPSNSDYLISSPDILIRHAADIDLQLAAASGLESFNFQQPKFGETNYVYVALNNRGTQTAMDNFVKLYWYDPSTASTFPEHWSDEGFFRAWSSDSSNSPGSTLSVPMVEAGGRVVVGPILWRPPAPETAIAGDGVFRLGVRASNPYDFPPSGGSTTMARDSNNVSERRVAVLRGPFAQGVQNTLVLRVHFPNIATQTDEALVIGRVDQLDSWVDQVSWGQASITPVYRGPIVSTAPSTDFMAPDATVLIELAEDVLDKLVTAEPGVLEGGDPSEEITRVILVTNDLSETTGWATSSAWPYTLDGQTRYLTVSVHGGETELPAYALGMSRQFGMRDLFAHENVFFSRPYADGWDNMAAPHTAAHPLVWSKELANWVSFADAELLFVPRPDPGDVWNNGGDPVHLRLQASQTGDGPIAVAFGLTHGVTSFVDETAFYYVEARDAADPGAPADSVLPGTGVLMYYANRLIPTGQGPVILRDHVPGGDLQDAAIPVGGSESPAGTGIQVQVGTGTNGADYDLTVSYAPPETDYDVYMQRGDPPWQSPDIWVDNQADGYDEDEGLTPEDRGNQGIAGEENRVYARVRNHGPATAHDVEVAFLFSEPYHTVGDVGSFDEFRSVFLSSILGNADRTTYVEWTPQTGVNPHTCARVELRRLFDDTNAENDWAQRNLQVDHSVHGSPYTEVTFPFSFRNAEETAELIYFRADGIPDGWVWSITPSKALVAPGAQVQAELTLQPPDSAPDCTEHPVHVTGWVPRGNTLVRLGGATVRVDLRQRTEIQVKVRTAKCSGNDLERLGAERKKVLAAGGAWIGWDGRKQQCMRTVVQGCTNPVLPNQEITIRYEGADGEPVYKTVMTDASGCYEDFNVVVEGGDMGVDVNYPGDACLGPATDGTVVAIALDPVDRPEPNVPDGDLRVCSAGISADVVGEVGDVELIKSDGRMCLAEELTQSFYLKVSDTGVFGERVEGEIRMDGLRSLHAPRHDGAGRAEGRFVWKARDFTALGSVNGLYGLGTSRIGTADCPSCIEAASVPGRWELELRGVVIEGKDAGAIIQTTLVLDEKGKTLSGAIEGSFERQCGLSAAALKRRLVAARLAAAEKPQPMTCAGARSCLGLLSKRGEGEARLDMRGHDSCFGKGCGADKTWQAVTFKLVGDSALEDGGGASGEAELTIDSLIDVFADDGSGRGRHGGTFIMRTSSGGLIRGEMTGTSVAGAHRKPGAQDLTKPLPKGRKVGRLSGEIVAGPDKGGLVEARYTIQVVKEDGRKQSLRIAIDGWTTLPECDSKLANADPPVRLVVPHDNSAFLALLKRLRPAFVLPRGVGVRPPGTADPDASEPDDSPPRLSVRAVPRKELPEHLVRPLKDLPADVVRAIVKAEGGRLDASATLRLQLADRRFRELDRRGAGAINAKTFARLYAPRAADGAHIRKSASNLVGFYLRRYDRNADERLSPEEFGRGWDRFEALDRNGDKLLDVRELSGALRTISDAAFAEADSNADRRVDFREFALWWRTLR